jgi:uncharacterized protein YcsI (UPF0317 family)
MTSAADVRAAACRGTWRGTTGGHCPAYQQANLVILPQEAALEFAAFCTRNPTPCPLIEITPPGDPEPVRSAPGADLRTDLPGYRIYRKGELTEQRGDIRDLWRDDLVAFLLGCSLTVEHALIEAGVPVRNVERGTMVPMFVSTLACVPAGRFHGPMVVTMRPIAEAQVDLVRELSARYPHAHGAPIHIGDPEAIGITDLSRPDYGEPVPVYAQEIPVFWGCGVTPQAVAVQARVDLMITHEPAQMFVTDLPREGAYTPHGDDGNGPGRARPHGQRAEGEYSPVHRAGPSRQQ